VGAAVVVVVVGAAVVVVLVVVGVVVVVLGVSRVFLSLLDLSGLSVWLFPRLFALASATTGATPAATRVPMVIAHSVARMRVRVMEVPIRVRSLLPVVSVLQLASLSAEIGNSAHTDGAIGTVGWQRSGLVHEQVTSNVAGLKGQPERMFTCPSPTPRSSVGTVALFDPGRVDEANAVAGSDCFGEFVECGRDS
jgi:hypothetical protein